MFKVAVLSLAFFSAVSAETTFKKVSKESDVVKSVGIFSIPPDNGDDNWGDRILKERVSGDVLVSREIQVNAVSDKAQTFTWNANFPNKKITHVRILNIGRQRGFVESLASTGDATAEAVVHLQANLQFRLLIEVYAK